jgi:VanZ family protein
MPVALARRGVWLGLGWGLVVAVVYLSLTPQPPSPEMSQIDTVGHVRAYATLMGWWSQLDTRHCRLALLFVLMGLVMEIAQGLTDTRQGDVLDMAANSLGVGIGWLTSRLRPDWLRLLDRRLAA